MTAFVVFPTASSGSVTARASGGSPAISAIPPALSVIGPNASIEMIIPVTASMLAAERPIPYSPSAEFGALVHPCHPAAR